MKKAAALSAVSLLALTATACGGGGFDSTWFDENCSTEISDVHETINQGQPAGAVIGEAMTQGPIHPPANLSDSEHARIGLYHYDELSGAMELEREVTSDDVFCLEPEIHDPERRQTIDTRAAEVEGDLHGDVYEADFTMVRSPEFPDGIWMGLHSSGLPRGIHVTEDMPEECALEWWAVTDEIDLNATGQGGSLGANALTRAEDC